MLQNGSKPPGGRGQAEVKKMEDKSLAEYWNFRHLLKYLQLLIKSLFSITGHLGEIP
jgi:hypothetical protein